MEEKPAHPEISVQGGPYFYGVARANPDGRSAGRGIGSGRIAGFVAAVGKT